MKANDINARAEEAWKAALAIDAKIRVARQILRVLENQADQAWYWVRKLDAEVCTEHQRTET